MLDLTTIIFCCGGENMGTLPQERQVHANRPRFPIQQLPKETVQTKQKANEHNHAATD